MLHLIWYIVKYWVLIEFPHIRELIFFLTIVDDFTRCTWVFLMQHRSETQHLLTSFVTFAHTQFHANIKAVRVDNGSEFLSMKYFFQTNGIE